MRKPVTGQKSKEFFLNKKHIHPIDLDFFMEAYEEEAEEGEEVKEDIGEIDSIVAYEQEGDE